MKEKIIFNWMLDLRKNKIDPIDRAEIIQEYITKNKISQRELGKQLGISHTVIQDWLLWNRITKKERDKLKTKSSTTEIYRLLRNNRTEEIKEELITDERIKHCIKLLKPIEKIEHKTKETKELILTLKDICNRMLMYLEKK